MSIAGATPAGCLGDRPGDGDGSTPERCEPDDVSRPPVVEDTDHRPQGYGTKPAELTEQSVADYLSDFETAYAWNPILNEHDDVKSLNVTTVDDYTPEPTDEGFLAASRIETASTVGEDQALTEREYVTNYFVSDAPSTGCGDGVGTGGSPVARRQTARPVWPRVIRFRRPDSRAASLTRRARRSSPRRGRSRLD